MDEAHIAQLIEAFGKLRDNAVWASVVIGFFIAICFIIYFVIKYKRDRANQESQDRRAREIIESNEKISTSLDSVRQLVAVMMGIVDGHKQSEEEIIWPTVNGLRDDIKQLTSKVAGTTDAHDSLNIVRLIFFKAIYYEIRDSINELLYVKESDFKIREQYVANKVRTNIGEVLSKYKGTLSNFKLSINSNLFFKLNSTESIERFILVDIIWSETREYFLSQLKYEQKLEECSLKLFNIIKDYVNTIISEINEENKLDDNNKKIDQKHELKPYDSSRTFRTPLPFKMPGA